MRVTLIRTPSDDKQTLGNFIATEDDGDILFQCKTLELDWEGNKNRKSCIPVGKYPVVLRFSNKYKWHYHVTEVPGRDLILIHNANYARQLLGCIAIGVSHTDIDGDGYRDVTNSVKTKKKMLSLLPDEFELEII